MSGNTETLARFVVDLDYAMIAKEVIDRAKRQIMDVIGVALAGSRQPVGRLAANFVERTGGTADCKIWGTALESSAPQSAFANGVSCHALDYDDMWLPGAHPTGAIFPAALAMAEKLRVSGRKLLVAQVAGYEIMGKLHLTAGHEGQWHPTPVFGTFGAAAAVGKLLELDSATLQTGFGIAASEASGIKLHSGTMTKPFHSGHAARNGVVAAMLAAEGFSANPQVFDRGFFEAFYGAAPNDDWQITSQLGNPHHLISPGIGIKMYPSGYHMHHTFEAALELAKRWEFTPDHVRAVEVAVPRRGHFDRPIIRRGLEGKFSHQYHVALAVLDRKLTIESFCDERALAADVQDFIKKISLRVDPALPRNPDLAYYPVTIHLGDGKSVTAAQPLPRSHWRYPLPRSDWEGKFWDNANRVVSESRTELIVRLVDHLEEVSDVRELTEVLAWEN